MILDFKGKVALVTGASSQIGFGKAIALTFAKYGCDLVMCDIDIAGTKKTAEAVEALGRKALAIKTDVASFDEVNEMVKKALAKFGKIDIFCYSKYNFLLSPYFFACFLYIRYQIILVLFI